LAADTDKTYLEPDDVAAAALTILRQPAHVWTQEMNVWPF
jgi:NADP-dependent 3-hydroxy acid dehydrogenase YdfG